MKSLASIAVGVAALASVANASVKGFDISNYQPNVDFAKAYSDGARFVIIKVRIGNLPSWCYRRLIFLVLRPPRVPLTLIPPSVIIIPKPPMLDSSVVVIILRTLDLPLVPLKPTISSNTEEVGLLMALLCLECLTLSMPPVATAATV
jgi:hypothetical protein